MSRPHLRYKNQTRRERTWTIHFIAAEKAIKGTILLIVAFKMLTLFNRDVHAWAQDFVTRHGIDLANRYVQSMLERLSGVGNTQLIELSIVATVYAALLFTEGIGLWLQKRWAEYMTTYLTALFIPFEIYEIYERFTWVRIVILGLNLFVVWYLATRLRDEKREILVPMPKVDADAHGNGTRIKICGITNLSDALLSVKYGADELGFNFYKESPRFIAPEKAAEIIKKLPKGVKKVGVFVNESVVSVCKIAHDIGLDLIQLHGDESSSFCDEVREQSGLFVIKAFRIHPKMDIDDALNCSSTFVLLDGYSPTEFGGTGETADWDIANEIVFQLPHAVYLAGGLSPANVRDAITKVQPYAVDVCSRTESEPGKKDPAKLRQFIAAVKETI